MASIPEYPLGTQEKAAIGTALTVGPAAIGCAVGILIGEHLRKNHQAVATSLFALGALAVTPALIDLAGRTLSGPQTRLGSRRTLTGIRSQGIPFDDPYEGGIVEDHTEDFRQAH